MIVPRRRPVSKFWKYTLVGTIGVLGAGWAFYLFSGDVIVDLFVRTVEKLIDIIIGLVGLKAH